MHQQEEEEKQVLSNEDQTNSDLKLIKMMNSDYQLADIESDETIKSQKKQKKASKLEQVVESTTISLVINIALGFFFYRFSTNDYHYESDECKDLKLWSKYYAYYCFLVLFVRIFIFLPVYFMMVKGRGKQVKACYHCLIIYQSLEVCMSFVFLIGLTFSYFEDEPCGNLRILVRIYLLIVFLILALAFCCAVGIAGLIGGIKIGSDQ